MFPAPSLPPTSHFSAAPSLRCSVSLEHLEATAGELGAVCRDEGWKWRLIGNAEELVPEGGCGSAEPVGSFSSCSGAGPVLHHLLSVLRPRQNPQIRLFKLNTGRPVKEPPEILTPAGASLLCTCPALRTLLEAALLLFLIKFPMLFRICENSVCLEY